MTKMQDCEVRKMVAADLEQVLEWRNHPDVRKYEKVAVKSWISYIASVVTQHPLRTRYTQEGATSANAGNTHTAC